METNGEGIGTGARLAAETLHLAPERLADETLLCHYAEPGTGVLERAFLAPAGVRPKRTMEMHVTPAVVEMARAGYAPAYVIPKEAPRRTKPTRRALRAD